jgi:hypothetical protein
MSRDPSNSDRVTEVSPSLDLFDALGVPSPELARRLVRMLNLPAVVQQRLAAERSDAA